MRVGLMTTDTPHHLHFAREVALKFPLCGILMETGRSIPRFETDHPFERERDDYEREALLAGSSAAFDDLAETRRVDSINDAEALDTLRRFRPDVTIVFGTRRLRPPAIASSGVACLNLHGGNPEEYRGLDTHLWAVYHEDFGNLVTTLHHVDAELDTGAIVGQETLRLDRGSKLFRLRAINTCAGVSLSLRALARLSAEGSLPKRPQSRRGRYYSFMPAVLKGDCVEKLDRHVSKL